jgi:hypothetical protein
MLIWHLFTRQFCSTDTILELSWMQGNCLFKIHNPSFKTVQTHSIILEFDCKKNTLISVFLLSKGFYFQTGLCDMSVIYSEKVQLLKLSVWHLILRLREYVVCLLASRWSHLTWATLNLHDRLVLSLYLFL